MITNIQRKSTNAQSGFTLIELIIVIIILGILSAVALPKFVGLSSDARLSSLNALQGSIKTTIAMSHGKYIVNTTGTPPTSYTAENVTVAYNVGTTDNPATGTGLGYLSASDVNFAALLGTDGSYVQIGGTGVDVTATLITPAIKAGEIGFIPKSVAGTPQGVTCFVKYIQSSGSAVATVPNIVLLTGAEANPC